MKRHQATKHIHLKAADCEDGRAHDVEIETKTVAFGHANMPSVPSHQREETIRRARELVSSLSAYSNA